ncbi:GumC family protein [Gloeobacter morelensis]|uniref:Polysaccharide biosynthesis tyrosine autokinase n=1 Tax=Gloeobacter morelensis MG652769 TaxID=2781736 RepID=A0ABY3PK04_9CYAN|nr:polysaccharide biosynthesis tyrosine autokinase [Gloeobacter morelensis]UFP94006.1 polysaccharide biosynthesis tyrosine autokinase [Gloeobacter morelensis MG652769]
MGLREYLRILNRHWPYAAGTALAVVTVVTVWTFALPPVWEAQGRLLFKQKDTAIDNPTAVGLRGALGQMGSVAYGNPLDTQAEILQSRPVAAGVIRDLQLADPRQPGELLGTTDFLRALKVEALRRTDLLVIKYRDRDPAVASKVVNTLARHYIDLNMQQNRAEAASTRSFVEAQLPAMEQRLRASERRLRSFKEQYGSVALAEEQQAAVRLLSEFRSQQAQADVALSEAGARVRAIDARMGGLSEPEALVAGALSGSDGMRDLRKTLLEIESKLAVARAQYQDSYPEVEQLIKRRGALRALLASEADRLLGRRRLPDSLLDAHLGTGGSEPAAIPDDLPRLDAVRQQLLKDLIAARVEELATRTRTEAIARVSAEYDARVAALPRLEESQRQLARQVEADQEAYRLLQKKFYEYRILEAQNIGNATLIEPAELPEIPAWPKPLLNLAAGGVLALILGALAAYTREFFDDSLRSVEEARGLLGTSLLGGVPRWNAQGGRGPLIVLRDPLSPVSEAYRSIRTHLKFLSSERGLRAFVLTSASPQEGKSTTAANLAAVSAQAGARVLLVDGDLRKPRQHTLWDLDNRQGFSTLLVGESDWQTVVRPTSQPGLAVLTAGPPPPNPVALLESRRLGELLGLWSEQFDLVIFDTPPLTAASDALVLGALGGGLVLVVRPGIANKRVLAKVRDSLKRPGIELLGHIVNGTIAANEGHDEYYYYNRYGADPAPGQSGAAAHTNGNSTARRWFQSLSTRRSSKPRS